MAASVHTWLCGRPQAALARQIDRVTRQADVTSVAVMPDVHPGRTVPNGIVVATRRLVYPDLVGADIGCGMSALRFRATADDLPTVSLGAILVRLPEVIPTLKVEPDRAERQRSLVEKCGVLSCARLGKAAAREGVYQLGTLGRGNHFLELAVDDAGALWSVVHTGSRAMGQEITAYHLHASTSPAGRAEAADALPALATDSDAGTAYLADMAWACRYATANRIAILNVLADLLEEVAGLSVDVESFIDSPHNMARREIHAGEVLVVHRKSANHAAPGVRGLIAGSMAVGSRIAIGLGNAAALESSAHGAGRVMSRKQAMRGIGTAEFASQMKHVVYHRRWAHRFRDEAPQAYRDLHEVMRAQRSLVRTERSLTPILNDKRP